MSKQDYIDELRQQEQESINEELMARVEDDFADYQQRSKEDFNGIESRGESFIDPQ